MAIHADPAICPITMADAEAAWALSSALGWPHRPDDWRMFIRLGRGFAAMDGSDVVGTALWWPYGETHGSVGMVIVSPSLQGRGIGRRLMDAILQDAGDRTLRLNATTAGLKLYRDLGFVEFGKVRQFQGTVAGGASRPAGVRIDRVDDEILDFDRRASGMDRRHLLATLLQVGEAFALRTADDLQGVAFRRSFGRGQVVGPVVAMSQVPALAMVRGLVTGIDGFVRLDVIDGVPELNDELLALGLSDAGAVSRMQRGRSAAGSTTPGVFALAGQALG